MVPIILYFDIAAKCEAHTWHLIMDCNWIRHGVSEPLLFRLFCQNLVFKIYFYVPTLQLDVLYIGEHSFRTATED